MHASKSLARMRTSRYRQASTSGRGVTPCRCRCQRMQVSAALFEPPPFQPTKLSVQYLAGARPPDTLSARVSRRYTLTHNDITGALNLSIGLDYNQKQIQGFYTRILRDEITAEWYFASGAAAPAELHVYCHVSGEERWLAPPQLRNFIFRREMTLVLDTFYHADAEFLQRFPDLMKAKVYVHFQSDVQDLDLREFWGTLGDRRSWHRMPCGVLARLKLLLFGFPALPHSRPRTSLTRQKQQQQQQQGMQDLMPLAAATAAGPADVVTVALLQEKQQQRHTPQEAIGDETRPVALSVHQQRNLHPQEIVQLQQQLEHTMLAQSSNMASSNSNHSSSHVVDRRQACSLQQQKDVEVDSRVPEVAAAGAVVRQTLWSNGHGCSSHNSNGSSSGFNGCVSVVAAGPGNFSNSNSSSSNITGTCLSSEGNDTFTTTTVAPQDAEQLQQQQMQLPDQLVRDHGAAVAPVLQQVQQRDQVMAFTDAANRLQVYRYWLQPGGGSSVCSNVVN